MIILYNVDKEVYYKLYVCVIDIHDEWDDYEITSQLVENIKTSFDNNIGAYKITNDFWISFLQELDKWLNSDRYIRAYDEEKHYEIYQAIPLYKVYDKYDEWCNEICGDTLNDVQRFYFDTPSHQVNQYRAIPYFAEECDFRPKLMKWSGEI